MRSLFPKTWQSNRRTIGRTCVFIFWNGSTGTEISWRTWLQATKHGSLSTIQKQKDKVRNGIHLHHHVQKSEKEQIQNKIHAHLLFFFDSEGIVHTEFVPQGHTVNQFYYREILERLRKRVVRVRPSIADNWMLHHDNASCHTAISVIESLLKRAFLLFHSPHTPLIWVRATSFYSQN